MNIAIINSGVGNLGAIPNMLARLGANARVTLDPVEIESADRIVLPGVGSFDAALRNLTASGVLEVLRYRVIERGTPLLGVCLGMELLADRSEEGSMDGLGWIPGEVVRFRFDHVDPAPRIPHMGWNIVRSTRDAPLLRDLGDRPRFYFAHSFHFRAADPSHVIGVTDYGGSFASAIQRDNIAGIQFHPEKSHRFGLAIFRNFLEQ
jgi:imidazole glycerol phosphate synthase, glutamine amidotransferase subunit